MKSGTFINLMSKVLAKDVKTVTNYARILKEANLISTGARGVNAPDMTPRDFARLLIAFLATDIAKDAPEAVQKFGTFKYRGEGIPFDIQIKTGDRLEYTLTRVLSDDLHPKLFAYSPRIWIDANQRLAYMQFHLKDGEMAVAMFQPDERNDDDRRALFGIRYSRGLSSAELSQLWVPLALEREKGMSWEEINKGYDAEGVPLDPLHPWNMEGQ